MKRLRVTEIGIFLECRLRWYYKYERGLSLPESNRASPMITGSAVHAGIEKALLLGGGTEAAIAGAVEYLGQYEGSERYMKGVTACLNGVDPAIYRLAAPQVELELSWEVPGTDYVLVGKPDLWYIGEEGVTIEDYKTTSKDEEDKGWDYQQHSMQTRLYGMLVYKYLESQGATLPIYLRHRILSTRGNHFLTIPMKLTGYELVDAQSLVTTVAGEIERARQDPTLLYPTRNPFNCGGMFPCEYAPIDDVRFLGKEYEGVIEEEYIRRER